jgi:pyridoxal phosphate enzyme (YggS family)
MDAVTLNLAERVAAVQAEIARACGHAGRSPDTVTLIAVSKTHPAATISEALAAGIRHFGENRVEEALPKMAEVALLARAPVRWHMIGHVQSRKARTITPQFALLHSLDSVKLAGGISRAHQEQGTAMPVLLEINISGEATKEGLAAYCWQEDAAIRRALWDEIAQIVALPGVAVRGLMTMAPLADDPEAARPVFAGLRGLRDALADDFPQAGWSELSMGMTDDYAVAIEEGATLVRIGRAIFGARRPA